MNQLFPSPGIAHFDVVGPIGRGGLGTVDLIQIVSSACVGLPVGSRWARKRLNANFDRHPEARQRFEREILATKSMDHPNIVPYRGENLPANHERFYLMPAYPSSLRDYLAQAGPLPLPAVVRLGVQIADALQYAHDRGFRHRDLKPENILLAADGSPAIADWGLGYFVHKHSKVMQHLTRGGMGTEYYCSLEQWNTGKCGPAGAVYSLGMVLAELATGAQLPIAVGMGVQGDVLCGAHGAQQFNALVRGMTQVLASSRVQPMTAVSAQLSWIGSLL